MCTYSTVLLVHCQHFFEKCGKIVLGGGLVSIGNRIKNCRTENQFTQKELANKLGLTPKMFLLNDV